MLQLELYSYIVFKFISYIRQLFMYYTLMSKYTECINCKWLLNWRSPNQESKGNGLYLKMSRKNKRIRLMLKKVGKISRKMLIFLQSIEFLIC